ncbi:DNA adenine methylase [Lactobacillus panisapium]|nr:DNA adenine methylase [Lactobacillus panisapium]
MLKFKMIYKKQKEMVIGIMSKKKLKPLLKYPGGKGLEYKYLKKLFPMFNTYVEPFLGGGAVFWAVDAQKCIINDCSKELMSIYRYCEHGDELFIKYLQEVSLIWNEKNKFQDIVVKMLKNSFRNLAEYMYEISDIARRLSNITYFLRINETILSECLYDSILRKKKSLARILKNSVVENWQINALGALGGGIYTYLRGLYNHVNFEYNPQLKTVLYYYLREYSYSSMFRYNSKGEFNVPFGGNTYAKKDFSHRLKQIKDKDVINKLKKSIILQEDFSKAFVDREDTFMFLDPPYDTEFSTYDLHVFDASEQVRLRNELLKIKKTKWLMVVKSTDFIEDLYNIDGWYRTHFDKAYSVNFKNRNDKNVKHLVITNYKLELKNGNI